MADAAAAASVAELPDDASLLDLLHASPGAAAPLVEASPQRPQLQPGAPSTPPHMLGVLEAAAARKADNEQLIARVDGTLEHGKEVLTLLATSAEPMHPKQGHEVVASAKFHFEGQTTRALQDQDMQTDDPPAPVLHVEKAARRHVIAQLSDIQWDKLQKNALILIANALDPQDDPIFWMQFEASGLGLRIQGILEDLRDSKKKIVDVSKASSSSSSCD